MVWGEEKLVSPAEQGLPGDWGPRILELGLLTSSLSGTGVSASQDSLTATHPASADPFNILGF